MVQAAPAEVYDEADLLSDDEEEQLSLQIQKLSDTYDMNFVVLTIDDAEGKTATEYADDFYVDKGYNVNDRKGGAIYLVDMDNREVRVEADQDMQYYLTDKRADEVIDAGIITTALKTCWTRPSSFWMRVFRLDSIPTMKIQESMRFIILLPYRKCSLPSESPLWQGQPCA